MKAGALKGNSPCEVVQACDITFCCVADTTAVKDVRFYSFIQCNHYMGLDGMKPVYRVFEKLRLKPVSSITQII